MTAEVELADFQKNYLHEGEVSTVILTSPATMDSGDTVDVTDLLQSRVLCGLSGWDIDTTNGVNLLSALTYELGTGLILVDTGGGTTDSTYVLEIDLLNSRPSR